MQRLRLSSFCREGVRCQAADDAHASGSGPVGAAAHCCIVAGGMSFMSLPSSAEPRSGEDAMPDGPSWAATAFCGNAKGKQEVASVRRNLLSEPVVLTTKVPWMSVAPVLKLPMLS